MTSVVKHPIRPGGLCKFDHEMIFSLAARGWKSGRIAATIEKHPSTVQWFMYRHGLKAPDYRDTKPFWRNGRLVVPFTRDEDAFITALRIQGFKPAKIAELTTKRYGNQRSHHTVACRLVMLAAREDAA
jgi:IS30 family transposase